MYIHYWTAQKKCDLLTLMLRNCSVLINIKSSCFEWGLWGKNGSALVSELKHSHRNSWSTYFTWNSYTPVYCSLRTIVHRQICGWLKLDKPAGGLRASLFWPMRASHYNQTDPRWPITGLEKCQEIGRERERYNLDMEKAPLHRRAALKILKISHLTNILDAWPCLTPFLGHAAGTYFWKITYSVFLWWI
jgi:hypothetical protein